MFWHTRRESCWRRILIQLSPWHLLLIWSLDHCRICWRRWFYIRVWGCIGKIDAANASKRTWRWVDLIFKRCCGCVLDNTRSSGRVPWLIILIVTLSALLILIILRKWRLLMFLLVFNQNFFIDSLFLLALYLSCLYWKIQLVGELRTIQLLLELVSVD